MSEQSSPGVVVEMGDGRNAHRVRTGSMRSVFVGRDIDNYAALADFDRLLKLDAVFSKFRRQPWFPAKYPKKKTPCPPRSLALRAFLVLTDHETSRVGFLFTMFVMVVIVFSCVAFVYETDPGLRAYHGECAQCAPVSGSDYENATVRAERAELADQCAECEPQPVSFFVDAERFCVAVFTFEYLGKLLTAHAAPSAKERRHNFRYAKHAGLRRTRDLVLEPLSLVDLVAILPFYIHVVARTETRLQFVRVVRLFRMFRVVKVGKLSDGVFLFVRVIRASLVSFVVFILFSVFGTVVFASLVYFAEKGEWDPATGEFLRPSNYFLKPDEPSPFTSIAKSSWWVLVTFTTVGYGDMVPTTQAGKVLGTLAMYIGIILVAMPITIMGYHLTELYMEEKKKWNKRQRVRHVAAKILNHVLAGRRLVTLRKAWNTWFAHLEYERKRALDLPELLRQELARSTVGRTQKHAKSELKAMRSELRAVQDEVALMRRDLRDFLSAGPNVWANERDVALS